MSSEYKLLPYARKHRPTSMAEYEGNEKAKRTFMNNCKNGRRVQTILIIGHSGCGKTTLGRIIEKEYLCENRDDIKGACCTCFNCREMDKYIRSGKTEDLSIDSYVTEVDLSKDTGKAGIDAIIEEAQYTSLDEEWRIWLFDEFHKASDAAKQALLKIMEEPPKKVLFICCTTEPDKIPITLMTRFQLKLTVKKPKFDDLMQVLHRVLSTENIKYEDKALGVIIDRSEYVTRTALNRLEEVVNEKGSVTYENTIEVLEEISDKIIFKFYSCLLSKNTMEYVRLLCTIKNTYDISQFVESLVSFTRRGIYIINGSEVDGLTEKEMISYKELFSRFTVQQISFLITKLMEISRDVNAETGLLLLGYTGIFDEAQKSDTRPTLQKIDSAKELSIEQRQSLQSVSEKRNRSEQEEEITLDGLTKEASEEDILSMFNATKIEGMGF